MVKINGEWYNHEEIITALKDLGYVILTLEVSTHRRDYPLYETYAIIDGAEVGSETLLKTVAIKEFQKPKPKLKRVIEHKKYPLSESTIRQTHLPINLFPQISTENRSENK